MKSAEPEPKSGNNLLSTNAAEQEPKLGWAMGMVLLQFGVMTAGLVGALIKHDGVIDWKGSAYRIVFQPKHTEIKHFSGDVVQVPAHCIIPKDSRPTL